MAQADAAPWTPQVQGEGFDASEGRLIVPAEGMVTEALVLTCRWGVASQPGHFAQWTTGLDAPQGDCELTFYVSDDFTGPTAGYHFIQVLVDEKVLWQQDVAGGSPAPTLVRVKLPAQGAGQTPTRSLSLRLLDKKAVTNFGVAVRLAGIELISGEQRVNLLPLKSIAADYRPWPEDKPLDALPFATGWSQTARIVQPWGATQTTAVLQAEEWAPRLSQRFGFNAVIMLPTNAHNAITVGRGKPGITDAQFRRAVDLYRANDIKLILYTSIMHCGHDPSWQFGDLGREHPEWSMRDPEGGVVTMYGQPWLCPSTGALEHTLRYTEGLLRDYAPAAVMLDNSEFMNSAAGRPTCYCESCKRKFREYVLSRFGEDRLLDLTGIAPEALTIPQTEDEPLWGLWLAWRKRAWANAMETYRQRLRQINPDIVVLANTQYRYSSWILATDAQYQHEDAILAESRSLNAGQMAAKMVLGKALAQERPLWNYIGTFNETDFSLLRPAGEVAGVMAASAAAGANPWIVFYGFTGEQNQASIDTMSQYMSFSEDHSSLLVQGTPRADVAVLLSPESRDMAGSAMPPVWLVPLLEEGFACAGLWGPAGDWGRVLESASVAMATSALCMRDTTARLLAQWVHDGGTLIVRPDTAWRDEYGRWRAQSALSQAMAAPVTQPGRHAVGAGAVLCIEDEGDIPDQVRQVARPRIDAASPVSLHWRALGDAGHVLALVAHEPGVQKVTLRLPVEADKVSVLQPGEPIVVTPIGEDGFTVTFTMQQRLALVQVGG